MNKLYLYCLIILSLIFMPVIYSQDYLFKDLMIQKELNPSTYVLAKQTAVKMGLPVSIKLSQGILIEVLKTEKGKILYSVIKNFAHPFSDGEVLTYEQVSEKYDLTNAEIFWGTKTRVMQHTRSSDTKLLLVPNWTNDNVMSFDPVTGDLVNANYIPPSPGNLDSPKEALLNQEGFISVSDQLTDLVQKYDTAGNYVGIYAPAGGVNNTILDNIRGHAYRPSGNLVVTVGSGANQNGIPEFDNSGAFLGNFIANGAGGLNSPFCILFRDNDVLVTGSSSDAAHRYDLSGSYLDNLITGVQFPQQIIELPNGNLALAVFSTPSGLGIYTANGNQLHFFTQVTSLRGVYLLPGGTYLVTNSAGIHEIDSTNGNLIRTIYSATSLQYISYVDYSVIPVELTTFNATASGNEVILSWSTATETNNSGFEIQRLRNSKIKKLQEWEKIGFVFGFGTTTELKSYSFIDENVTAGAYKYRLKQIDFDGTFSYSKEIEIEVNFIPKEYALEQNYPNPFNPSTTIKFALPEAGNVTLTIYNTLGQKVTDIVNTKLEGGVYNYQWNAKNAATGIYIYELRTEKYVSIKKMLLLK
jgi:hypothetical protein